MRYCCETVIINTAISRNRILQLPIGGWSISTDKPTSRFSGIDRIINDAATEVISEETGSRNILLRYKQ